MSLRMRLFLIFGGLIAVLMSAQWWMLRAMTRNLEAQVDDLAFSVGSNVAAVFAPGHHLDTSDEIHDMHQNVIVEKLTGGPHRVGFIIDTDGNKKEYKLTSSFEGKLVVKKRLVNKERSLENVDVTPTEEAKAQPLLIQESMVWNSNDPDQKTRIFVNGEEVAAGYLAEATTTIIDHTNHEMFVKEPHHSGTTAVWSYHADSDEAIESLHVSLVGQGKNDFIVMNSPSIQKAIPIPKSALSKTLTELYNQLFVGSIGILLLGLLVVALVSHRFATPLRQLAATAQKVGEGSLGAQVKAPRPNGEVGIAIHEFNKMSIRLQELDAHNQVMRQREYLSELGEIADGLAHTIRNPLNTLGLSVEQLSAMVPDSEAGKDLGHVARQQIRRIDQWIRSFMALACQGSANEESVRLDGLLHDIMLEALHDGGSDVDLDIDLEDNLPTCQGVKPEIRAVIQALVVNAVEASPQGGKVLVRARRDGEDALRIEVEDEGPGLPEEVRQKLFTPHVTTKVTGSGMGLFLARRIITSRYGGDLTLADKESGGVLAVVTLPLEREKAHV